MSLHATRARPPAVAATADVHWSRLGRCGPDTADWFIRNGMVMTETNLYALALCEFCPVKARCAAELLRLAPTDRRMLIAGGLVTDDDGRVVDPPMPSRPAEKPERPPRPDRQCTCDQWFTPAANSQRYCSVRCRKALHNSLRVKRTYYDGRRVAT